MYHSLHAVILCSSEHNPLQIDNALYFLFFSFKFLFCNNITNRGTYYDPKKHFCGDSDCYKILGFNFETWGRNPPSIKDITQSYRKLSRRWHPDKNKDKGAKGRFVVSFNRMTQTSYNFSYHMRQPVIFSKTFYHFITEN